MSDPVTETAAPPAGNPLAVHEGVKPTIPLLLGFFVVHVAVWIGLILLVPGDDGVDYVDLGILGTPWVRQFIIPLLVVLAIQIAFISRMGWWKSVMGEPSRTSRTWLVVFPVLILLVGLLRLAGEGLGTDAGASYLIACFVTMALVGTTEELSFRGVHLVGARRIFTREWQAVVFSAALFGLFHTPNILIGAEVGAAIAQTFLTAILGLAFYCLRRVSGTLIPCIVLHALYDFMLIQGNWDKLL